MNLRQEANCQAIQWLWNQGIQNAINIHNWTNIPITIINDNFKKLKKSEIVQQIEESDQLRKILANQSRVLAQYIH